MTRFTIKKIQEKERNRFISGILLQCEGYILKTINISSQLLIKCYLFFLFVTITCSTESFLESDLFCVWDMGHSGFHMDLQFVSRFSCFTGSLISCVGGRIVLTRKGQLYPWSHGRGEYRGVESFLLVIGCVMYSLHSHGHWPQENHTKVRRSWRPQFHSCSSSSQMALLGDPK